MLNRLFWNDKLGSLLRLTRWKSEFWNRYPISRNWTWSLLENSKHCNGCKAPPRFLRCHMTSVAGQDRRLQNRAGEALLLLTSLKSSSVTEGQFATFNTIQSIPNTTVRFISQRFQMGVQCVVSCDTFSRPPALMSKGEASIRRYTIEAIVDISMQRTAPRVQPPEPSQDEAADPLQ